MGKKQFREEEEKGNKGRSKQNLVFCGIRFALNARTSKCERTDFTVEGDWKRQHGFPCWGATFKFLLASF